MAHRELGTLFQLALQEVSTGNRFTVLMSAHHHVDMWSDCETVHAVDPARMPLSTVATGMCMHVAPVTYSGALPTTPKVLSVTQQEAPQKFRLVLTTTGNLVVDGVVVADTADESSGWISSTLSLAFNVAGHFGEQVARLTFGRVVGSCSDCEVHTSGSHRAGGALSRV